MACRHDHFSDCGVCPHLDRARHPWCPSSPAQRIGVWLTHLCPHDWAYSRDPCADGDCPTDLPNPDGAGIGLASCTAKPRSFCCNACAAEPDGESLANGGTNRPAQPGSPTRAARRVARVTAGGSASSDHAASCDQADHGSLGVIPRIAIPCC